jgi:hypothetical protein
MSGPDWISDHPGGGSSRARALASPRRRGPSQGSADSRAGVDLPVRIEPDAGNDPDPALPRVGAGVVDPVAGDDHFDPEAGRLSALGLQVQPLPAPGDDRVERAPPGVPDLPGLISVVDAPVGLGVVLDLLAPHRVEHRALTASAATATG